MERVSSDPKSASSSNKDQILLIQSPLSAIISKPFELEALNNQELLLQYHERLSPSTSVEEEYYNPGDIKNNIRNSSCRCRTEKWTHFRRNSKVSVIDNTSTMSQQTWSCDSSHNPSLMDTYTINNLNQRKRNSQSHLNNNKQFMSDPPDVNVEMEQNTNNNSTLKQLPYFESHHHGSLNLVPIKSSESARKRDCSNQNQNLHLYMVNKWIKELSFKFYRFMDRFSVRRHRPLNYSSSAVSRTRMTSFLYAITIIVTACFQLQIADGCSSRSTPKPRPPSPTLRPNITIQTYTCPPDYDEHYCLNGATCFTVKIGESILYNCECAEGYMGQRCEFKDLDGSYLPSKQRAMLEQAGITSGAVIIIVLMVIVCFYLYVRSRRRSELKKLQPESANTFGREVDEVDFCIESSKRRPFSVNYLTSSPAFIHSKNAIETPTNNTISQSIQSPSNLRDNFESSSRRQSSPQDGPFDDHRGRIAPTPQPLRRRSILVSLGLGCLTVPAEECTEYENQLMKTTNPRVTLLRAKSDSEESSDDPDVFGGGKNDHDHNGGKGELRDEARNKMNSRSFNNLPMFFAESTGRISRSGSDTSDEIHRQVYPVTLYTLRRRSCLAPSITSSGFGGPAAGGIGEVDMDDLFPPPAEVDLPEIHLSRTPPQKPQQQLQHHHQQNESEHESLSLRLA